MKHLIALFIAVIALGSTLHTKEAMAHVDGYAIADGVLGIIGGALERRRGYYYDDYCDLYPYACRPRYYAPRYYAPRYRYYAPRHYRKHYRKHYRHHRKHHH